MVFKDLARKGISLTFVIVISFFFSFFFAYADESDSSCEECTATYVPGETKDIAAIIITDKNCPFCATQIPQKLLKSKFPGIKFEIIDYKEKQARKLISQYKIQTLPRFLIDPLIKEEEIFDKLKVLFEIGPAKRILLREELSGICMYLRRREIEKKIDLFLDLYAKNSSEMLDALISFSMENKIDLKLHFIIPQGKKSGYPKEEVRVALAIRELCPSEFNNYIYRRIKDIEDSSWIDTAEKEGLSYKEIRKVMMSSVMDKLIKENKQLAEELMVGDGNTILIKNNRIFKIFNINKEELKSFFKEEENNG